MRVRFMRNYGAMTVIEVIQFTRYDNNQCIGLIMTYSTYGETKSYNKYESTEPVDESDYKYMCEQLLRTGYLDLTQSKFVFKAYKAKPD